MAYISRRYVSRSILRHTGQFFLQVLGAVAQLERALIAERTKAGIKAAKARGKLPGNPGLRERPPEAIRAVSQARNKLYLDELIVSAQTWLPVVRQLRPQHSWENVVRVLNRRGHDWTVERLRHAVHRLVREKLAEKELLARSPRRASEDHQMKLAAAITIADPTLSLRDIGAQLDQMGERPAGEVAAILRPGLARRSPPVRAYPALRPLFMGRPIAGSFLSRRVDR